MKKILILLCAIPLLLCCQGGGTDAGGSANVANAIGSKPNGAVSDSQRVATLEQEVQMLMAQYDIDHNPQLLEQAMHLNDSIEKIDTTQQGHFNTAFVRAQLLAKSGHMREAMAIQEELLKHNSDEFVRENLLPQVHNVIRSMLQDRNHCGTPQETIVNDHTATFPL